MTTPTTEKTPVTNGDPGHRDRLAASEISKSTPDRPGELQRRLVVATTAASAADETGHGEAPHDAPSAGRRSGSPSRGNWSSWKMTISVTAPPVMRRTSIVSGRYAPSLLLPEVEGDGGLPVDRGRDAPQARHALEAVLDPVVHHRVAADEQAGVGGIE